MSVEMCVECDKPVDTDYNVEGQYSPDYEYYCEDCCEVDPMIAIGHEIRKSQLVGYK